MTMDDAKALMGMDNVMVVVPERSGRKTLRFGNTDYATSVQGVGAVMHHVAARHGGVSALFMLRKCAVVLVYNGSVGLWPSLYTDKFGEDRQGQQRGLPLRLNEKRLAKVEELWRAHGVPQEVIRSRVPLLTQL